MASAGRNPSTVRVGANRLSIQARPRRSQTLGSYALLFNALLHHGYLTVRPVADQ